MVPPPTNPASKQFSQELLSNFQRLADAHGLTLVQDIEEIVGQLQGELESYTELELRSDGRRIDLITTTADVEAVNKFLEILRRRGATEEALQLVDLLKRFGAGKRFILKIPITGGEIGGEFYIRGAVPISEGAFFLDQHLPGSKGSDLLFDLAEIFGKGHTHMIAADAVKRPSLTFFLTTYLRVNGENEDQQLLTRALAIIGFEEETIGDFIKLHRVLGAERPKTLYFSWPSTAENGFRVVKIDYTDIRLGLLAELMAVVGSPSMAEITLEWGQILQAGKANYGGVVLDKDGLKRARAYFTIRLT